jgi:hypothetical protein
VCSNERPSTRYRAGCGRYHFSAECSWTGGPEVQTAGSRTQTAAEAPITPTVESAADPAGASYWLTPVKADDESTATEVIARLVGDHSIYDFGEKTPGRKHLAPGDKICLYASQVGVVGHAEVASRPEKRCNKRVRDPDQYPWVFKLRSAKLYLDGPVAIDSDLRGELEAFRDREAGKRWGLVRPGNATRDEG